MSPAPRDGADKEFSSNDITQKITEGCQCCAALSDTWFETLVILPSFPGGCSSTYWKRLISLPLRTLAAGSRAGKSSGAPAVPGTVRVTLACSQDPTEQWQSAWLTLHPQHPLPSLVHGAWQLWTVSLCGWDRELFLRYLWFVFPLITEDFSMIIDPNVESVPDTWYHCRASPWSC